MLTATLTDRRPLPSSLFDLSTRRLSPRNQMLCGHAEYVGGIQQWNALGRAVNPGAQPIEILVPCGMVEKADGRKRPIFKGVKVYDIADTSALAA